MICGQKMKKYNTLLPIIALVTGLVACGGGGSESTPTTPAQPTTPTQPTSTIEDEFGQWLTDLSTNVILPNYSALETSTGELVSASETFCTLSNPDTPDLSTLKQAWRDVNLDWQAIQWLKVGPIVEQSRAFRMQFWPDSNDAVSRGVENLLLEQQQLSAEIVAGENVGAQGIPALEILLFNTASSESLLTASNKEKRCQAVVAISQNMKNIAYEVHQGWLATSGNYVESLIQGTGDFTGKKDAVEELVTNWLEQIERVKDEKMLEPIGINSPGIPSLIEFTLSEASLSSIHINANSFIEIYTANGGHGFDDILNGFLEQPAIATQMTEKLTAAKDAMDGLAGDYPALLSSEEGRAEIIDAIQKVREVRDLLTADFVQATDINIGFNSNDGD